MCYRPLHIKNNCSHYDSYTMPLYFSCPCGKCEDCKRARQSEWFIRSFYEWERVKHIGGCGFFYTLTFNDENLPKYKGIKCFDRNQIQLFCKRLKENLKRRFGIDISYLLSCEYGTLYQRPHYHALFFITRALMPWTFYNLVESAWQYGFVYCGTDGGLLSSPSGILYVTKYITKDFSFTDNDAQLYCAIKDDYSFVYAEAYEKDLKLLNAPETFDQLIKERSSWVGVPDVISYYNDFMLFYRRHSSFNAHSVRYGYDMLNRPTRLDLHNDKVLVPSGSNWIWLSLPRYALRYLYFDRVLNDRTGKRDKFVLSAVGKQHFLDTLDVKIDSLSLEYQNFFTSHRVTDFQFSQMRLHFNFEGNKDLRFFLDNLKCDFRRLAIYSIVYRNRFSLGTESFDYWHDYKSYLSSLFEICENKFNTPLSEWSTKAINHINDNLFNFHPNFVVYEQLLLLYQEMVSLIRKEQAIARHQKYENERKLRDVIKISHLNLKRVV